MNYSSNMIKEVQDLFSEGIAYETLINQNKRDHKINITDIAITKVPYVKYPNIPIEECNKLHELSKLLLGISQKENNSNEVAITYKLNKEPNETEDDRIAIAFGDEHEVDLGADTKTFHLLQSDRLAVINIHNHPNCSNFSLYDVSFFLRNDSIKLLILLSNKGELNYLLKEDNYSRIHNVTLFVNAFKTVAPYAVEDNQINLNLISPKDMITATNIWIKQSQNYGIKYQHVVNMERSCDDYEIKNNATKSIKTRDDDGWEK